MIRLANILVSPTKVTQLTQAEISEVIAEARYNNMLGQLNYLLEKSGLLSSLSSKAKAHLDASNYGYVSQQKQLRFEADEFFRILKPLGVTWIYLKGSAYQLSKMTNFNGRVMADIDLLVDEKDLPTIEHALSEYGWYQTHIDDYDDKFYREWSHEIPPLRHIERRVELDLHFNILPKTLNESPHAQLLIKNSLALESNRPQARVLSPEAMAIHSSVHLFYESEFHKGFRDLFDLYLLLSDKDDIFWNNLKKLQTELGNGESMHLALRYCKLTFGLEYPESVERYYNRFQPSWFRLFILDFAFKRVFEHSFPPNRLRGHKLAELILYCRGHLKRMPIKLLIPHFCKKTIKLFEKKEKQEGIIF